MTLPIDSGTWTVDAAHTQLSFSVRHLGISSVRGIFRTFEGKAVLADGNVNLEVTAQVKSIDTGNEARDGHLQSPDFFDSASHPTATFRATGVDLTGANGVVKGELTLKGITHPISLNTTFNGTAVFPMDKSVHAGFEASGTFLRSAFGVSYGVPMVSDEVKLVLEVQLVHQP
jgi:polyisoprenoid-binding protein YceI